MDGRLEYVRGAPGFDGAWQVDALLTWLAEKPERYGALGSYAESIQPWVSWGAFSRALTVRLPILSGPGAFRLVDGALPQFTAASLDALLSRMVDAGVLVRHDRVNAWGLPEEVKGGSGRAEQSYRAQDSVARLLGRHGVPHACIMSPAGRGVVISGDADLQALARLLERVK